MPARYHHSFEPYGGFRLFRDQTSLLLQSISTGQPLSARQNLALVEALDELFDTLSSNARPDGPSDRNLDAQHRPLCKDDFAEAAPTAFYKYVRVDTCEFARQGRFQFGTAEYYRNSPNIDIRDRREGAGHFHLISGNNQLNVSLLSGYNCAIYCGTRLVDGPNDSLMRARFGPRRIKIDPAEEFMRRASKLIGARRSRIHDVVYTDVQSYTEETNGIDSIFDMARGNLTEARLHEINIAFFALFYEFGLMPGLYAKPSKYAVESERRLVFETDRDIRDGPIIVDDNGLRLCDILG